jgi:CheY-like chemotaxis protein
VGTVLFVDDEVVIIGVVKPILEQMGYNTLTARSGQEAIDVYQKNLQNIDIILLDMIMPVMDGGETYDRLKAINPDVKVILTSGYSIDGQANEILERGCDGFIQKPFTIHELNQKLTDILAKVS